MRPTKISKELSGAFVEEQTRQAIDAAKKKAVAQHADYDTFKKMVRHLIYCTFHEYVCAGTALVGVMQGF